MKKNNFGFDVLVNSNKKKESVLKPIKLKIFFGEKSFETSWQFIETLA
jgi:hypothetical protein